MNSSFHSRVILYNAFSDGKGLHEVIPPHPVLLVLVDIRILLEHLGRAVDQHLEGVGNGGGVTESAYGLLVSIELMHVLDDLELRLVGELEWVLFNLSTSGDDYRTPIGPQGSLAPIDTGLGGTRQGHLDDAPLQRYPRFVGEGFRLVGHLGDVLELHDLVPRIGEQVNEGIVEVVYLVVQS
jgi:hypothetical protein